MQSNWTILWIETITSTTYELDTCYYMKCNYSGWAEEWVVGGGGRGHPFPLPQLSIIWFVVNEGRFISASCGPLSLFFLFPVGFEMMRSNLKLKNVFFLRSRVSVGVSLFFFLVAFHLFFFQLRGTVWVDPRTVGSRASSSRLWTVKYEKPGPCGGRWGGDAHLVFLFLFLFFFSVFHFCFCCSTNHHVASHSWNPIRSRKIKRERHWAVVFCLFFSMKKQKKKQQKNLHVGRDCVTRFPRNVLLKIGASFVLWSRRPESIWWKLTWF